MHHDVQGAMSATEVVMDPNAPSDLKDQARLDLEKGVKTTDVADSELANAGSNRPGTYDGQNAARRVIDTGRHTGV